MVKRHREKYDWEFIFLGANIDAISKAAKFGITPDRAANYNADCEGTRLNYDAVNCVLSEFRASSKIDDSWKVKIYEDFAHRSKRNKR